MKVTIGICTWNRARWLDRALASLYALAVPRDVDWDVVVVKNNCTDGTDEVLGRHGARLPLRVFEETRQGVSPARNRLLEEADADLLLFADDDAVVTENWLAAYVAAARERPDVAFFGGPIEPVFESDPPAWLERIWPEVRSLYGELRLADAPFAFDAAVTERLPYGSNFGGRAPVLQSYRFDGTLGRKANDRTAGEETAFFMRLLDDGHAGVWIPEAPIRHWVRKEYMTVGHLRSSMYACGKTDRVMNRARTRGPAHEDWRRGMRYEAKVHWYGLLGQKDKRIKYALRASYHWGLLFGQRRTDV